jgi:hypothetical protein
MIRTTPCLALTLCFTACAFGPRPRTSYEANSQALRLPDVVVFQNSTGSLSYQSAAGRDAGRLVPHKRAQGRACQRGLQLPLFAPLYALGEPNAAQRALWLSGGWGQGAYQEALDVLRRKVPADAVLYDVRADLQIRMFVSIYREQCLLLDAGVALPAAQAQPQATTVQPTPAEPQSIPIP